MSTDLAEFDGLTYVSAAYLARLGVRPTLGHRPASVEDGVLYYDPTLNLTRQRAQVLRQVALQIASPGDVVHEIERELNTRVLPI